VKDGEPDFSKYTAEQIERSLRTIDREKYPLNYANLLAAREALPPPVDPAVIEANEVDALKQTMVSGEVWISVSWTWLVNTLLPAVSAIAFFWIGKALAVDPERLWSIVDARDWYAAKSFLYGVFGIGGLALIAWLSLRMRHVVIRNGELEVRSQFARASISLHDIERVRWNDAPEDDKNRQALIELRVDCRLGRRVRFFPRSLEVMRALASHVAVVQGRAVADPAYKSVFHAGTADP
jgi:hypothetical protein